MRICWFRKSQIKPIKTELEFSCLAFPSFFLLLIPFIPALGFLALWGIKEQEDDSGGASKAAKGRGIAKSDAVPWCCWVLMVGSRCWSCVAEFFGWKTVKLGQRVWEVDENMLVMKIDTSNILDIFFKGGFKHQIVCLCISLLGVWGFWNAAVFLQLSCKKVRKKCLFQEGTWILTCRKASEDFQHTA